MNRFIYVFTEEAFDELILKGFKLLKANLTGVPYYIFENSQLATFDLPSHEIVFSDTLTF